MSELIPYVQIILKRLWLIALLVVVTVAGIYYVESTRPPKYQASVRLQILTVEPEDVTLFTPLRQPGSQQQIERTGVEFINVLRNREVAWEAAREINKELGTSITADDILSVMWPWLEGEFLYVTYVSADTATLAKRMADVHIQKALDYYRTERTRSVTAARLFIEKQVQRQAEALSHARDNLAKFQLKYNLADIDREATAVQDQIRSLKLERDRAQIAADEAAASARVYREKARALREQADRTRQDDPERAAELDAQADTLEARAIAQEAALESQRAAISRYERLITAYQNRLAELIGLEGEYKSLVNAVKEAEDRYAFLAGKLNEAKIKEDQALNSGYIQVIEAAREPVQPAPRQTTRLIFYGAALATMLGVILAFVLEALSRLVSGRGAITPAQQETR